MSRRRTGSKIGTLLTAVLVAGGLTALTASALAGAGGPSAAKAAKVKCAKGSHKKTVKKHGKKRIKCVANQPPAPPVTPGGPTAALAISPTSFTYPDTDHNTCSAPPDPDCTVQAFTVTNVGGAASGVPAIAITEINNPIPGDPPGFVVSATTCDAAVPAGGSCVVGVYFKPNSNANPQPYTSVLHVTASPGNDAQASLAGTSNG
jgi:hypothetical protein